MAISMIRGYGLPNDAASSYNGYGAVRTIPQVQRPRIVPNYPASLFRTLPDPELGGYGEYDGFGAPMVSVGLRGSDEGARLSTVAALNTTNGATPSGDAGFLGPSIAGIPVVLIAGVGLLGLFFFMRK